MIKYKDFSFANFVNVQSVMPKKFCSTKIWVYISSNYQTVFHWLNSLKQSGTVPLFVEQRLKHVEQHPKKNI